MWLDQFATELRVRANASVTVDAATWNTVWNFTLLSASAIRSIDTMSTYTSTWSTFEEELEYAVANIPMDKLTVGLETTTADATNLTLRFNMIEQYNVSAIAIWVMPIPDVWWSFLEAFVQG